MKNVSSQFRNELNNGNRRYVRNVKITLKDGSIVNISNKNLWQNGLKLETAVSGESSFDLGSVIIGQLTLVLNNIEEEYSRCDFTDCVADDVKVGLELSDGTIESLSYGKFYLSEANYNGSIITLTFYDCIYKFDKSYSKSNLKYPATLGQIVRDACEVCGVSLGTPTFEYEDYVIQNRPNDESLTFRQVLQWVGQVSCHYFYSDPQGRLAIGWYDTDTLENIDLYETVESTLDDLSGSKILDHDSQQIMTIIEQPVTSGEIPSSDSYQIISSTTSFSVGLDDVVITGVKISQEIEGENGTETIVYQSGNDGYVLEIAGNKLIQGEEGNVIATRIGSKLIGVRFRTFSVSALSDPTIEAGDVAILVDRKGRRYKSVITNNTFQPGNYQNMVCGAEAPARKSASRYSQITQVYVDYRKELEKERTDREQALSDLGERIDNSSGLFTTIEEQPDGSKKYYLHNKPTIEDSDILWSMTAEAWGVSTDGGETQNAGMTVDGDTIVRILSAVGVNADWIKTGAFRVEKNGQVMFNVDTATGQVDIVANSLSIRGQTMEEIADQQLNDFVDSVYSPTIINLQNQIDGQIETYYYDYEPTLSNEPAVEWTTEEERQRHEGDLFYWKSKGYAYRFFKDGNTWKWQMVQDTDITMALQQAAEAQDTADQKRRVFVSTPTPPYEVGDLWVGNDTSELMRCQRSRNSGSYNASDWIKAVKYTDDSELYNFVHNDYNTTIQEIYQSVDQKAETWYQNTDPALGWTENENTPLQDLAGENILDLSGNTITTIWEKEKSTHDGDLWKNPSNNVEYIYQDGIWIEMAIPDAVFDTIDGKAQIFVVQPTPPYNIGDTWFTGTTILVCNTRRDSGEFVLSDWAKNDNYTDDSALYDFIEGDYAETIEEIQAQTDQKAETWYQSTDPSLSWTTDEKAGHAGDLWYNTTEQKTYIYNGSTWSETKSNPPDEVFDSIDGKAQIFISQPTPPYSKGDLWFDSTTSDIMTCIVSRSTGSFNAGDWQKRNKYTDDSYAETVKEDLDNFSTLVTGDMENLQVQIDGKIETYYYDYQPTLSNLPASEWTDSERITHVGDLFYWESKGFTYRFMPDGNSFKWQPIQDSDIEQALEQASQAQDTADSKRRVFYSTPVPPYDVGDLWAQGSNGDIMRCKTSRQSGAYQSTDWELACKYTDDTAVDNLDESLDMQGVFNRLTNNGAQHGLFIQNNTLYLNAGYMVTGILASKDGKSSWNLDTGVLIVGDESSRINAGILQSPNYASNGSGIQINLNTGIIKGEIEASSFSARDNLKIYNGGKEHTLVTGNYSTDGIIFTTIGCDLENFSTSQTPIPSIVLNKSGSTGVVTINAGSIGLNGSVSTGYLATSDINAAGNVSLTGKLIADSASITNIISAYGFDGGWIIESGNRMRVDWRQNSSGVWTLFFYIDDQLVRTW